LNILGAKNDRAKNSEKIRKPPHRLGIHRKIPFAWSPIHFDLAAARLLNLAAHEKPGAPVPNHLAAGDAAKRSQRRQKVDRFENIRFALRVISQQQMKTGRELHIQSRVISKIPEPQMAEMHAEVLPEI
jgi:hypothetical protein